MYVNIKRSIKVRPVNVVSKDDTGAYEEKTLLFPCSVSTSRIKKLGSFILAEDAGDPYSREYSVLVPIQPADVEKGD